MLQREGIHMNHKKLRRIYAEEKLQVRRRGGRKRALGMRRPMEVPDRPNQRWSLDFVSDAFTDGRRFRILTVVDDFSKENVLLVPDTSISGLRVTRELDQAFAERGMPRTIVSDNGTEFTSMAILKWVQDNGLDWHYIQPGKPTQNAFIESFNGKLLAYEQKDGSEALFGGEIEVDESYFGGRRIGKRGRGAADKIPVFGLFKRSEKVYTKSIPDASGATLIPIIKRKVMP